VSDGGIDKIIGLAAEYHRYSTSDEPKKAEKLAREKQEAARARTASFKAAQQGLYVLTGVTASILVLIALRNFSRSRQLA
jgi:ADP-ribosylglycohydrolase